MLPATLSLLTREAVNVHLSEHVAEAERIRFGTFGPEFARRIEA